MCLRLRSLLGRKRKKNKDDLDYFDAEGFGHEEEMRDAVLVAVDQAVHEVDVIIIDANLTEGEDQVFASNANFLIPIFLQPEGVYI